MTSKNISISLPIEQQVFINHNPRFNLSKFVQLKLKDYMELVMDIEHLEKQYHISRKEVILE